MVAGKNNGTWRFELVNQAIPLTIGFSPRPGPFDPNWKGEKDPGLFGRSELWSIVGNSG